MAGVIAAIAGFGIVGYLLLRRSVASSQSPSRAGGGISDAIKSPGGLGLAAGLATGDPALGATVAAAGWAWDKLTGGDDAKPPVTNYGIAIPRTGGGAVAPPSGPRVPEVMV